MIVALTALLALAQCHVVALSYCHILCVQIGGYGGHDCSRRDHHHCHCRILDIVVVALFARVAVIVALAPHQCILTHISGPKNKIGCCVRSLHCSFFLSKIVFSSSPHVINGLVMLVTLASPGALS